MNSLEFIEKEIVAYNRLKEHAILRIAVEDDEIELYKLQRHINTLNERIPIFQQIKTELEALEVVKEELQIIDKTTNQYGEPLYRYELNVVGQDKINTLKKGISKKVEIRQRNSLSEPYFVCPTCNKRLDEENEYCPYCKQKLDYSSYYGDEDE